MEKSAEFESFLKESKQMGFDAYEKLSAEDKKLLEEDYNKKLDKAQSNGKKDNANVLNVEENTGGEGNNKNLKNIYEEVIEPNGCKLGEQNAETKDYPVLDKDGKEVASVNFKSENHLAIKCGTDPEKDFVRFQELAETAFKGGFDSINFSEKNSPEFNALLARACAEHEPPIKTLGYEAPNKENTQEAPVATNEAEPVANPEQNTLEGTIAVNEPEPVANTQVPKTTAQSKIEELRGKSQEMGRSKFDGMTLNHQNAAQSNEAAKPDDNKKIVNDLVRLQQQKPRD